MWYIITGYGAGRIHVATKVASLETACGRKLVDGIRTKNLDRYKTTARCRRCFNK